MKSDPIKYLFAKTRINLIHNLIICSAAILYAVPGFAQRLPADSTRTRRFGISQIAAFDTHPDTTVYNALQQFMNANLAVSYVSIPMIGMYTKSIERVGPLVLGEGVNGYILEGPIDLSFTLNQGRRQQSHWKQTSRFSFKYAPGVRMTQDNSSNLLPTNQKVGFQVEKVLWDSYTKIFFTESSGRTLNNERRNFFADSIPVHSLNFNFIILHYSNGQPEGVYRSIDSARNDYIKGDFSTNLLQPSFTYSYFNRKKQLLSVNLGYQRDASLGGPFGFLNEQKQRYGQNRVIGYFQWKTQPVNHIFKLTKNVKGRDGNNYKIMRPWEYRIRTEYEYILGDLSKFKRSKDYRFNWHLYMEGQPLRSRAMGYTFHLYRGRDYFNIRYDDIVWIAHVGVTFTINRYHNPRFHPDDAIIEKGDEPKFYQKQQKQRMEKIR